VHTARPGYEFTFLREQQCPNRKTGWEKEGIIRNKYTVRMTSYHTPAMAGPCSSRKARASRPSFKDHSDASERADSNN